MSALRQSLADYLSLRRELGFKLDRAGRLLASSWTSATSRRGGRDRRARPRLATMPEDCSPAWVPCGSVCCALCPLPARLDLGPVCPDELLPGSFGDPRPTCTRRPGCGVDDGGEGHPLAAACGHD